MKKGKLIALEGLDGCGKATQTRLLFEQLQAGGYNVCKVSFPDYNEPSSALVKMYLRSEFGSDPQDVNVFAASSFYAVDRYASYKKFWGSKYERGQVILADRYTTSNAIYQLARLEQHRWDAYLDWLHDYEYEKLQLPQPNLVIYLDMPVEVSQGFMNQRYNGDEGKKDIFEKNVNFLRKCRESSMYLAKRLGWKVVACYDETNGPKSIEEISKEVYDASRGILDF